MPDFAEAYCNWGQALAMQDRFPEAEALYRKAIDVKPDLPESYTGLGWVLEHLNRRDEALKQYDRVLRLKPDYADAHVKKAMLLLLEGKFGRGVARLRMALEDRRPQRAQLPAAALGRIAAWGADDSSCMLSRGLAIRFSSCAMLPWSNSAAAG